ncbi:UbiA prenyltransferase family protein [bacterium]|nr:UbiA prenyltransferase family protein [bacterium]
MRHIKKLIHYLESSQQSFWVYFLTALAFIFLRGFLEVFSNTTVSYRMIKPDDFFFHFPLWYSALFLFLSLLAARFTGTSIDRTLKTFAPFMCLIILPPILDLIFSRGIGAPIAYIFLPHKSVPAVWPIFKTYITLGAFFPWSRPDGVTPGILIELWLLHILQFIYIYAKTRKLLHSLIYVLLAYTVLYLFGLLATLKFLFEKLMLDWKVFNSSTHGSMTFYCLLCFCAALLLYFRAFNRDGFRTFFRKLRWTRIFHYLIVFFLGFYIGLEFQFRALNRINLISLLGLILSIVSGWISAVAVNDLSDTRADALNDPGRPLVKGVINPAQMVIIAFLAGFISVVFALQAGYLYAMIMLIVLSISFLYSLEPVRLKRIPLINQLVIGLTSLLMILQGYLFAGEKIGLWLSNLPPRITLGALLIFTLGAAIKDLQDYPGDKADNVYTLPVIFGPRLSTYLISILLLVSYIMAGVFLEIKASSFFIIAFAFSLINFYIIKVNRKQLFLFINYYVFTLAILFFYL